MQDQDQNLTVVQQPLSVTQYLTNAGVSPDVLEELYPGTVQKIKQTLSLGLVPIKSICESDAMIGLLNHAFEETNHRAELEEQQRLEREEQDRVSQGVTSIVYGSGKLDSSTPPLVRRIVVQEAISGKNPQAALEVAETTLRELGNFSLKQDKALELLSEQQVEIKLLGARGEIKLFVRQTTKFWNDNLKASNAARALAKNFLYHCQHVPMWQRFWGLTDGGGSNDITCFALVTFSEWLEQNKENVEAEVKHQFNLLEWNDRTQGAKNVIKDDVSRLARIQIFDRDSNYLYVVFPKANSDD